MGACPISNSPFPIYRPATGLFIFPKAGSMDVSFSSRRVPMNMKFRTRKWWPLIALSTLAILVCVRASAQAPGQTAPPTPAPHLTLDQAIDLALQHNHSLQV